MERTRKVFALLLALAFLATGMLGTSVAAQSEQPNAITGTPDAPRALKILKQLTMPTGTTAPTKSFTFTLNHVDTDPNTAGVQPAPVTVETGVNADFTASTASPFVVMTNDILANIDWPGAGTYRFTIKETTPTGTGWFAAENILEEKGANYVDKTKYSKAVYTANVEVRAGAKDGKTVLYVYRIGVTKTTDDDGTANNNGTKVEPDPGDNPPTDPATGVLFTNTYNRTLTDNTDNPITPPSPPTPTSGETVLKVSKTVAGNKANLGVYFPFKLTLSNPTGLIGPAPVSYKAYILVNGESNSATVKKTGLDENGITGTIGNDGTFDVQAGAEFSFKLKHNESLCFTQVPVGATWIAEETDKLGHTATAALYASSTSTTNAVNTNTGIKTSNEALTIGNVAEDAKNLFAVTNTYQEGETPTGLFYDNLPYLVLLAVAALGLI